MNAVKIDGVEYRWEGTLTMLTPVARGGAEPVPFHMLVSQSNGWLLALFDEAGVEIAAV